MSRVKQKKPSGSQNRSLTSSAPETCLAAQEIIADVYGDKSMTPSWTCNALDIGISESNASKHNMAEK
jgi:hypothetical protein